MMRHVVIIEDDHTIIDLMQEALAEAGVEVRWHIARDGTEGMRWVEQAGAETAVPDLVILDLNLPSYSGLEILDRLRSRDVLALVPVVVMSGSLNPRDREATLARGATLFLKKPHDLDGFMAHGRALKAVMDQRGTSEAHRH